MNLLKWAKRDIRMNIKSKIKTDLILKRFLKIDRKLTRV